MCVDVDGFSFVLNKYIIYFLSKLMYFCIMARNIREANKKEAFVHEQEQNKAKFIPTGYTVLLTSVCGIVSLIICIGLLRTKKKKWMLKSKQAVGLR